MKHFQAILGGWQLNGLFIARSGTPVNIAGVRVAENRPQGFTNHPNQIDRARILGGAGLGALWFDTSVFVEPTPGSVGNVGRNNLRGPGYLNYDAGLFRNFKFGEKLTAQFRAEAFNVTNSTHFYNPDGNFTSRTFGMITASFSERQIRFGLRLLF